MILRLLLRFFSFLFLFFFKLTIELLKYVLIFFIYLQQNLHVSSFYLLTTGTSRFLGGEADVRRELCCHAQPRTTWLRRIEFYVSHSMVHIYGCDMQISLHNNTNITMVLACHKVSMLYLIHVWRGYSKLRHQVGLSKLPRSQSW